MILTPFFTTLRWSDRIPTSKRRSATAFLRQAHAAEQYVFCKVSAAHTWHYHSMAEFYLAEGKYFRSEPLTESEVDVVRRLKGMDLDYLRHGHCYRNATLVARHVPGLDYAEGLALTNGYICPHAWLTLNGKPLDPTWQIDPTDGPTRRLDRVLRRVDHNRQHSRYFGIVVPMKTLMRHVVTTGRYSPIAEGTGLNYWPLRRGVTWRPT